jgi:starvation-inducible DNA-binding protein
MDKTEYEAMLKSAFATEFAFYLKAAGFHWNVEGSDFYEFHLLFERIYTEVYGIIDDFAEELRSTRIYVPVAFQQLDDLSIIEDQEGVPQPAQMAQELLADSDTCAEMFRQAFDVAEVMGDHGLSNFLADRQDAHKKHSWMLRSTLK